MRRPPWWLILSPLWAPAAALAAAGLLVAVTFGLGMLAALILQLFEGP